MATNENTMNHLTHLLTLATASRTLAYGGSNSFSSDDGSRGTSGDPWQLVAAQYSDEACEAVRASCVVADDPSAEPSNVLVEFVDEEATCPE